MAASAPVIWRQVPCLELSSLTAEMTSPSLTASIAVNAPGHNRSHQNRTSCRTQKLRLFAESSSGTAAKVSRSGRRLMRRKHSAAGNLACHWMIRKACRLRSNAAHEEEKQPPGHTPLERLGWNRPVTYDKAISRQLRFSHLRWRETEANLKKRTPRIIAAAVITQTMTFPTNARRNETRGLLKSSSAGAA